jgi:hypothetical protein
VKFKIRNWERFQHYSDRTPQWVKLHREILSSEDWMMGSDETRLLMIVLILLAAQQGDAGYIEVMSVEYIKLFGALRFDPDLQPLLDSRFIETIEGEIPKSKSKRVKSEKILQKNKEGIRAFADSTGFDEFWKVYGPHGSKYAAQWAWYDTLDDDTREQMVALTEHYLARRASATGFVPIQPNASTYLRNERWLDEFKTAKTQEPVFIKQRNRNDGDLLHASRCATRRGIDAERCTDQELLAMLDEDLAVVREYARSKDYDTMGKDLAFLMKWFFVETGRHPHE